MGRAQPWADFFFGKKMGGKRWGLLCSAFFTRKISRPQTGGTTHAKNRGFLQRFASWRNLLAVSSSDRAYQKSPGRVSDRERSPDLGLGRRLLPNSHPLETAKNGICADIIIGRLLGQSSAVP
jgi:hypothetical protein